MTYTREVQPPGIRRGLRDKDRKKQLAAASRGRTLRNKIQQDVERFGRIVSNPMEIVDALWDLIDAVECK
jgi:hypothetical protein